MSRHLKFDESLKCQMVTIKNQGMEFPDYRFMRIASRPCKPIPRKNQKSKKLCMVDHFGIKARIVRRIWDKNVSADIFASFMRNRT